jgi:hypothetical protein
MKLLYKIFRFSVILIFIVTVALITASLAMQDKVGEIILRSVSSNLTTRLDYGSFRLTLIKKFPKASLELKDVVVHSSSSLNPENFSGISTDTLLAARHVSLEFRITGMLRGNYNIERIGIRNGELNLLTDSTGTINYRISTKKAKTDGGFINLERINLSDITASYYNNATRLYIRGKVKNGRLKSRISGKDIDFTASSEILVNFFRINNTTLTKEIESVLDVDLHNTAEGLEFRSGKIKIEGYTFGIDGFISSNKVINLDLSGKSIDISRIIRYFPEKYLAFISGYKPSGTLLIDSKITGLVSPSRNPHIEINFSLDNGHFSYGKSSLSINDLSIKGFFSNGPGHKPETAEISVTEFQGKLGSGEYSGSFNLKNFRHPFAKLTLTGKVFPGEIREFFNLNQITSSSGDVDMDLKLAGYLNIGESLKLSDLARLNPDANLRFNSFNINLNNHKVILKDVNGILQINKHITADNLQVNYKGQRIRINGNFLMLPEWIAGKDVKPDINAEVSFSSLSTNKFNFSNTQARTSGNSRQAFLLPRNMNLNIDFTIDSLTHRTFFAEKVKGKLLYKPGMATFKPLSISSMGGFISGNCLIVQNSGKSFISKGDFNIQNVDINDAFKKFNDFGQTFIKAENLAGEISGTLAFLMPLDSMFKPEVKSLTAEGHFSLLDGGLNNFDPVKRLSSYIDISELQNISFDRLENDFFIRNNSLHIPMMDIRSSAADISVTGQHIFNNDYEYHVKMLLSVILSKKTKRYKNRTSEFGEIEEDGLGRTSLLLKIVSRDGDVKVSYDAKAVKDEIKENIKNERQNLKNILREEYGWYQNDTVVKQEVPAAKKSRFRIEWDEMETNKKNPDTIPEKRSKGLRNLFRPK